MGALQSTTRRLIPLILLVLGAGCATNVEVSIDPGTDFSHYRTWGWQPHEPRAEPAEPSELHYLLAREVHRALLDRGLHYTRDAPDLLVAPQLVVTQHRVIVYTTPAIQSLNSLHSSPSYQIQVTRRHTENWEIGQLVVVVRDARQGTEIWQGRIVGRYRTSFAPHLGESVASLFGRFPMISSATRDSDPRALAQVVADHDQRPVSMGATGPR